MKKIGLLPRLVLAIVLGMAIGYWGPVWMVRSLVTFNGLFGNFLNFVIPLITMGFVIPGIATCEAEALKKGVHEFADIITKLIASIIIPFLPVHIAGIFANMTYQGTVFVVLSVFSKVFVMVLLLHWTTILIQYGISSAIGGGNIFTKLKTIFPAYMTAIGTQSSAATIPVTLRQTYKMGVNKGIADFVIPLCATIHLSGSTITLTSCTMAILMLQGADISFAKIFPFILMLGVTMVAAPGVPGGAVMAALGILQSMLAFTEPMTALIIALYVAQDSFGTACNVTGDAAIACIVNKIHGYQLDPKANEEYIEDFNKTE